MHSKVPIFIFRKKDSLVAPAVSLLNSNVAEFDVAKVDFSYREPSSAVIDGPCCEHDNHTTSNLAIYSQETSKDKLSEA